MYRFSHHAAALTETAITGAPQYSAVWRNQPRSLAQAVRLGSSVVRATVTDVRQANDLTVAAAGEQGDVDRIPTQAITLR